MRSTQKTEGTQGKNVGPLEEQTLPELICRIQAPREISSVQTYFMEGRVRTERGLEEGDGHERLPRTTTPSYSHDLLTP